MSVSKEELLRLAKKAWPLPAEYGGHDDMAVSMSTGHTVRVRHPYEDDEGGLFVIHQNLAAEAAHAALLVLSGEDDRERLRAENAALREQLAARETAPSAPVDALRELAKKWRDEASPDMFYPKEQTNPYLTRCARELEEALRKTVPAMTRVEELEKALLHAVFAMQVWGSWEDGLPAPDAGGEIGAVGIAYEQALDALGLEYPQPLRRASKVLLEEAEALKGGKNG